jgi:hypothetical protein
VISIAQRERTSPHILAVSFAVAAILDIKELARWTILAAFGESNQRDVDSCRHCVFDTAWFWHKYSELLNLSSREVNDRKPTEDSEDSDGSFIGAPLHENDQRPLILLSYVVRPAIGMCEDSATPTRTGPGNHASHHPVPRRLVDVQHRQDGYRGQLDTVQSVSRLSYR